MVFHISPTTSWTMLRVMGPVIPYHKDWMQIFSAPRSMQYINRCYDMTRTSLLSSHWCLELSYPHQVFLWPSCNYLLMCLNSSFRHCVNICQWASSLSPALLQIFSNSPQFFIQPSCEYLMMSLNSFSSHHVNIIWCVSIFYLAIIKIFSNEHQVFLRPSCKYLQMCLSFHFVIIPIFFDEPQFFCWPWCKYCQCIHLAIMQIFADVLQVFLWKSCKYFLICLSYSFIHCANNCQWDCP